MKNKIKKPDFFIVGAPKCGTTALANYLGQHPDIFMAKQKESHHFATDLIPYDDYWRNRNHYLKIFQEAKENQIIGEASVFYLLSQEAAKNIKKFSPNAKIIIMLRNPVDLLYSHYFQAVYNGRETITDFEKALGAIKVTDFTFIHI